MRKGLALIAAFLAALMAIFPAYAMSSGESLALDGEPGALSALFEQMTGEKTEQEILALLSEFIQNQKQNPSRQEGEIISGVYCHPLGFVFQIPEGYQVLQDPIGPAVHLIGPANEGGFTPTIHVLIHEEPQPDFDKLTQTKADAFFGSVLENYQFVSLDHYEYNGVMAHEFVCLHGTGEDGMMIQNTLCFNKEDKAYILTMTTLAEEATLECALLAYDFFLAGFLAPDGTDGANQGNG